MHVEEIAGGLESVIAQSADGLEGVAVSFFGHIPSGAFGIERDQDADNDSGNHGTAHHQAPVQAERNAVIRYLYAVSQGRDPPAIETQKSILERRLTK